MSISKEEIAEMFLDVFPDADYKEFPIVDQYMSHGVVLQTFEGMILEWKISTIDTNGSLDRLVASNNSTVIETIRMYMAARKAPRSGVLPTDCVLSIFDFNSPPFNDFDSHGVSRKVFVHNSTERIQLEVLDFSEWEGSGWYTPNTEWRISLGRRGGSEKILSNLFNGTLDDLENKINDAVLKIKMEEL